MGGIISKAVSAKTMDKIREMENKISSDEEDGRARGVKI
jgi:hypothetical protein